MNVDDHCTLPLVLTVTIHPPTYLIAQIHTPEYVDKPTHNIAHQAKKIGAGMTLRSASPNINTTSTGHILKMKALSIRWYNPK